MLIFSHIIIPQQYVDAEAELRPDIKSELYSIFFKENSKFVYYIKKIMRIILVIPGLIMTPIYVFVSIMALKQMN